MASLRLRVGRETVARGNLEGCPRWMACGDRGVERCEGNGHGRGILLAREERCSRMKIPAGVPAGKITYFSQSL